MTPETKVNILVTRPLNIWAPFKEETLREIASVSPRLTVTDISKLSDAERNNDFSHKATLDTLLANAEIIFGLPLPRDVIARAPKLKWVHSPLAGVDRILTPEVIKSKVIVTNTKGIHGTQGSELVFTLMLMLTKQAGKFTRLQQEKSFRAFVPGLLHSKTITVLGLGKIGKEIARLAKAFGMQVIAVRARANLKYRYADEVLPTSQLHEALSRSDFVALALPSTAESAKIIGEAEFRAMKPSAFIINIGRGETIDEEAMIRALTEKRIAGAGLDVFAKEPLPETSKLWELPNVIITPHIAGQREDYDKLSNGLFCNNIRRYLEGRKLINLVNKKTGY